MKEMKAMLYRSHRGGVYYTPENTMAAFRDAIKAGFDQIETDPCCTKDGVVVLMHDRTINRTCRNADGSEIVGEIRPEEMTYEELMQYDAGICKGEAFRGEKIPRLDELIALAEGTGVHIALDKKIATSNMEPLFAVVEKYNTPVSFSCADTERIRTVQARFPDAHIDYDGETTEEKLREVCALVKPENLIVWMYLDKPNFAWLVDRMKVSPENCARTKKFARLGIANVNNAYDVREALSYDPYIVEV